MCWRQSGYCESLRALSERLRVSLEAYRDIVEPRMGFSRERELSAASGVEGLVDCDAACRLASTLIDKADGGVACVVTPASRRPLLEGCDVVLAVEGSLEAVARSGRLPDLLVGDLDPSLRELGMLGAIGVPYAVHVHGDNIARVAQAVRSLAPGSYLLTSQVLTPYCILPVGAFTDGDRAAAIAMGLGAREVRVGGFTPSRPLCSHKDLCDEARKRLKMGLGWEVLLRVAAGLGYEVEVADGGAEVVLRRPGAR